jgi:hypothetical protein
MQGGAHVLAVLWESAWALGDGESRVRSTRILNQHQAMKICEDRNFLPSLTIDKIGAILKYPTA